MDPSLTLALQAVQERHENLPAHVHGEDRRTIHSRIVAGASRHTTYEHATHQAALYLALAVAIDRSELADPLSGEAA